MPSIDCEGRPVTIDDGDTIASALHRAGVIIFSRSSKYHRPRGLYCGTGDCPN
jgi:sarcosine oxidase subunit alpha